MVPGLMVLAAICPAAKGSAATNSRPIGPITRSTNPRRFLSSLFETLFYARLQPHPTNLVAVNHLVFSSHFKTQVLRSVLSPGNSFHWLLLSRAACLESICVLVGTWRGYRPFATRLQHCSFGNANALQKYRSWNKLVYQILCMFIIENLLRI